MAWTEDRRFFLTVRARGVCARGDALWGARPARGARSVCVRDGPFSAASMDTDFVGVRARPFFWLPALAPTER